MLLKNSKAKSLIFSGDDGRPLMMLRAVVSASRAPGGCDRGALQVARGQDVRTAGIADLRSLGNYKTL